MPLRDALHFVSLFHSGVLGASTCARPHSTAPQCLWHGVPGPLTQANIKDLLCLRSCRSFIWLGRMFWSITFIQLSDEKINNIRELLSNP